MDTGVVGVARKSDRAAPIVLPPNGRSAKNGNRIELRLAGRERRAAPGSD